MNDKTDLSARSYDASQDEGVNVPAVATIGDLIAARFSRRAALKGMTAAAAVATVGGAIGASVSREALAASQSSLTFKPIPHGYDAELHVAEGYDPQIVIRWGDKVTADAPAFDVNALSAEAQKKQFGYNNDYIGFFPLPAGSQTSDHGLLVINHEYTDRQLMFAGVGPDDLDKQTKEQTEIELAAHGMSVIEVKRENGVWGVVENSKYARRINGLDSQTVMAGPVAGNARLKTSADATGTKVIGTLNNCAGGETPWGTVMSGEENFHGYFGGKPESAGAEAVNHKRYGISDKPWYAWPKFHDRFDIAKEPNEPNRYGWIVEFDPYDPTAVPKKRTALGRFKHEGATSLVNKDGRLVVYMGDDERFEYVYKFVSNGKVNLQDRKANDGLLDDGTLYVAKFDKDGTVTWMPLVHGVGPLTAENGFKDQADILIETRRAADLLGATPMDRPEDVEPNPVTGTVFVMLTNNTKRKDDGVDAANPRAANAHGHIVEIIPAGGRGKDADHAAQEAKWDLFLLAGNPAEAGHGAKYGDGEMTASGWLSCPDNVAFDKKGRVWIATDGAPKAGIADGVWAAEAEGHGRALTKHFLRTPLGAELCGPCFTPDSTTLFVAVQHPGDEKDSTFENPVTRWPDFKDGMPPRPSVVAIVKKDGGEIGS